MRTIQRNLVPNIIRAPGRFVGSRNSSRYHHPQCEWATKIKDDQRVWFEDIKDAEKRGYALATCCRE